MAYLTMRLGLAVEITRRNHKLFSSCNKPRKREWALAEVVLASRLPNSRCWDSRVRMWKSAADSVSAELPLLAFDQNYLCSPAPIVETNENFYTGSLPTWKILNITRRCLYPTLFFSQVFWDERIAAKCKEFYIILEKRKESTAKAQELVLHSYINFICFKKIRW